MKGGMFNDSDIIDVNDIIDVVASDDSVGVSDDSVGVVKDELCDFDFEDDITRLGDEVLTSLGKIHVPTKELRKKVRVLSGYGLNQERIAFIIGCTVHDIRRHYSRDCRDGRAYAFARIAQTGYKKALEGDTAMMRFYLKSMSKKDEFDDTLKIEHTGADGGDIKHSVTLAGILEQLDGNSKGLPGDTEKQKD